MSNPYEPPKSDISVQTKFKRSVLWIIYFIILALITVLGSIGLLFYENSGIMEYIQLITNTVLLAGLFGFVFLKKVGKPQFWLPFLIFSLLLGIFYEHLTNVDLRDGMTDTEFYISLVVGWLISIPGYIGLYLYSKPGNPPWNKG